MPNPNEFKIKFDGDLHQVSADILISSLISVSTILQEANNEINNDIKVDIKIKALTEGSFDVHWVYDFVEVLPAVVPLIPGVIASTSDLLTILTGVLDLKKHLKGDEPNKLVEVDSGNIEIANNTGEILIVNKNTYNIYNRPKVQDSVSKTFSTLEGDPAIESFEIIDKDDKVLHESSRADFEGMSHKTSRIEEGTRIITEIATIHIFKLVFDTKHKWEFYYKGNRISAHIRDDSFFTLIDNGQEFSKGDQLVVELQIEQVFDNTVNTYVNDSYIITVVKDHIPRAKQGTLDLDW